MPRLILCLLAVFFIAEAAFAKSYTVRSRYYVIESDLERNLTREVGRHMDIVFAEYTRRFQKGLTTKNRRQMKLYLFQERETYNKFLAGIGINGSGSGGMFFIRQEKSGLAVWLGSRDVDNFYATLQHEGFHQFAWMRIGHKLPVWANEGMAEYFGDSIIMRGKAVTGQIDTVRLFNVQQAIKNNKHLSFNKLINMTGKEWMNRLNSGGSGSSLQYDQSWSIVHFLVHAKGNKYRQAFGRYLQLINRDNEPNEAYKKAFGGDSYKNFEAAWKKYILELEPDPLSIAVTRARFLASGMRWLKKNKLEVPDTLAGLKEVLQKRKYYNWRSMHGGKLIYKAEDNSLFEPPPADNPRRKTEMKLVPNKDDSLPPEVHITGLTVTVKIVWTQHTDGSLVYEIVYQ